MRNHIQLGEHPDALYAVWQDRVLRAQRSTVDNTVLLTAPNDQPPPEGFDTNQAGFPAEAVPATEVGTLFSLQTHCLFDDDIYRVTGRRDPEHLTLRWTGVDARRATELGLTDFGTEARADELAALWQQRHSFLESDAARSELGSSEHTQLLHAIGRSLQAIAPDGWNQIAAQFRQVGDYGELEVRAVTEQTTVSMSAPARLSQLFVDLRSAMYQSDTGTWLQGTFTLGTEGQFDFDFDLDAEPRWRVPPGEGEQPMAASFDAELDYFPRHRRQVPEWLASNARLPLRVTFRHASVPDRPGSGQQPMAGRAPLPANEVRPVLDYLYRSPVVLARQGTLADVFAPHERPDVPDAFHTDGEWIWPAAVPHYLRKHGIPPEPELAERIRTNGYRPPYVDPHLRATATAVLLDQPYPPAPTPARSAGSGTAAAQVEPHPHLRASQVLSVLHRRLAEHDVACSAYRIGPADSDEMLADGGWWLRRGDHDWQVGRRSSDGEFDQVAAFDHVEQAGQFLLGVCLFYPAQAVGEQATTDEAADTDWPILPSRGEPPLHLLHAKHMSTLPAGARVQRFGPEAGNVTHAATAAFPETALPYERERQRQTYRVCRPLHVLTGISRPWGGLPGGAVAYLLPRAIGHHVETGALARETEPAAGALGS